MPGHYIRTPGGCVEHKSIIGAMAILAIVDYPCYYCNGFPARPGRKKTRHMWFCKKTRGPGGGQESQPADLPGHQPDRVETYSGYRLHERPRYFTFQGERLEVTRVLARWQEPEKLAFIVVAQNSRRYLLKYHQLHDVWEMQIWPGSEPVPA
jgi:hypothetical protein